MHGGKSVCVKREKKRLSCYWSGMDKRDERERTLDDASGTDPPAGGELGEVCDFVVLK